MILEYTILAVFIVAVFAAAICFAPKGWRTVAANGAGIALLALGAVLDAVSGFNWREVLPPHIAPWAGLAVLVMNVALRAMTDTRVGSSTQP